MNPSFVRKRKGEETKWIKAMLTAYPYRMTNKVSDETYEDNELIGSVCPSLKRKYLSARGKKYMIKLI